MPAVLETAENRLGSWAVSAGFDRRGVSSLGFTRPLF